ncbi:hypothetical protein CQA49_00270 [Helicobacter sp. MIT 00-7814]|uniref:acylneuraminate cytidylyltransferase family protein n=1 Tax=unclassified Helicobacter TaxID=2593540 RepID=UPI000E1F3CBC|nr:MULTISPECIES: acylneuraminate cytidylyltransferase family protein [unclassified Helicobacter]RDU57136.1 hypothetical protein CQA49_00270 [Helicobacter sp. MIT 00-7814]RDU57688.1 hypothetical protein CQA37_00270 [Helicobacter sp. MIT 99-10781]
MIIKALIPVRSGSERVKNKNIKPFAGSSLLEIKIKQLKRINEIDSIVVNSNCDEMLAMAKNLGVETIKRDEYFALSLTPNEEIYANYAKNIDCDVVLFADVTNPLLGDESIKKALQTYKDLDSKYDSLVSVNAVRLFMWQNGIPLNYDESKKPRSQDLPEIFALNYAVHIFPHEILKSGRIVGQKPFLFELSKFEALDIDEPLDFEIAEFLYKKYCLARGGVSNKLLFIIFFKTNTTLQTRGAA